MLRTFGAPHRYIQGAGALDRLGDLAASHGRQPLVIADALVMDLLGKRLRACLGPLADATRFVRFGGECSAAEIESIAAGATGADLVIGVGGGKAIDTAKGVRMALRCPLLVVPTVASNDSPTSRLVVVYTEAHALQEVRLMDSNPDVVLVDTAVVIAAPERFFVSGIGDALSKKFEAAQCFAAGGDNFYKTRPPYFALTLGEACYEAIRAHAGDALAALRRGEPDEHFERTVEATVLLSGLAFENGGLSIAHSLTRGLSAVPELARALHGEQVAYGLLVQFVLEQRDSAFMDDMLGFYRHIGLPRSLTALGLQGRSQAEIETAARTVAQVSWERAPYVRFLDKPVDEARLLKAILAVEAVGF